MGLYTRMKPHGPGMIGVPTGELGRFSDFTPSCMGLGRPAGTKFNRVPGLGPAHSLNKIGQDFLDRKELEWLFLTNDDNLIPATGLFQLLDRGVDVVSGYYLGRQAPFEPIAFNSIRTTAGKRMYYRYYPQRGDRSLQPIVACGDGCLLIRRRVLERIRGPWWEYGETVTDACDHDMVFCRKIREAGFQIWLDLDVKVDHISIFGVRPFVDKETGEWQVQLRQADEAVILLPAAHKEMK